jgi:hypothetical protein
MNVNLANHEAVYATDEVCSIPRTRWTEFLMIKCALVWSSFHNFAGTGEEDA